MRVMTGAMTMAPQPYQVVDRHLETADTVTLTLRPRHAGLPAWRPGQFSMIYAYGVGEVPISVSGTGDNGELRHTVRAVGAVTSAICAAPIGSTLGLRGPFGLGWPGFPADADILVVAGGIGLAPLRPVLHTALDTTRRGHLTVLIGARTPDDLLFTHEYAVWRSGGAEVLVTVDRADVGWTAHVGVITTLFERVRHNPSSTIAYICGPEMMMRLCGRSLLERGVAPAAVHVSIERDMRCGTATCGHCQLGPLLLCRDGPVTSFAVAEPLFATQEL